MSGPTKGVPLTWSPDDMHRLCLWAYRRGESMAFAVADRYNISHANARSRISRLRQLGYDVPSQLGLTGVQTLTPCGTEGAYVRHLKAGQKPCPRCREEHARRAKVYRSNGAAPVVVPDVPLPKYPSVRLLCDCGQVAESVHMLTRHTLSVHGRGPHRWERTPR